MREYETVYVLQPNMSEGDQQKFAQKYEAIVGKFDGTVLFNRTMGKKTLAYPINKQSKGIYYCLDYATSNGGVVAEIERQMKLDENVLRYLTTVRSKDLDIEARKLEIASQKDPFAEENETEKEKPATSSSEDSVEEAE